MRATVGTGIERDLVYWNWRYGYTLVAKPIADAEERAVFNGDIGRRRVAAPELAGARYGALVTDVSTSNERSRQPLEAFPRADKQLDGNTAQQTDELTKSGNCGPKAQPRPASTGPNWPCGSTEAPGPSTGRTMQPASRKTAKTA